MGTLLSSKFVRFRRKWLVHHLPPHFSLIIFIMICMQAQIINCSGGVNLPRPYLFRDYGMPHAFVDTIPHTQLHNLYSRSPISQAPSPPPRPITPHASSHYADSEEMRSSEEEQLYTAPLILDIDDPGVKGRWIEFSGQESTEERDDVDEEYYEEGSISSTEFSSRSSAHLSRSEDNKKKKDKKDGQSKSKTNGGPSDESRGMLENFKIINPLSFWGGEEEATQVADLAQGDEVAEYPEYVYESYAYEHDPSAYEQDPSAYYYDHAEEQNEQKKPGVKPVLKQPYKPKIPQPKPVWVPKVPKVNPKPAIPKPPKVKVPKPAKVKVPKPKPIKVKRPKPKLPKAPKPPKIKRKKRKKKRKRKKPGTLQYYETTIITKPDKLSLIRQKLSKLNPFSYVQFDPMKLSITKTYDHGPKPPPPKVKVKGKGWKKGKKPKPPKAKPPKQKIKYVPKPKPGGWTSYSSSGTDAEDKAQLEYYYNNPYGDNDSDDAQYDYRQLDIEEEDAENDDDEDEEEEVEEEEGEESDDDEDEEEEDTYYSNSPTTVVYGDASGEEEEDESNRDGSVDEDGDGDEETDGNTQADGSAEDDNENEEAGDDGYAEGDTSTDGYTETDNAETEATVAEDDGDGEGEGEGEGETEQKEAVEDDEADYKADGDSSLLPGQSDIPESADPPEEKQKSISLKRLFGWRKKKRRPKKPKPARRPPNWKQYRPAPLLPEIPDGVHDAVLKVIKNVGFLPEYDKNEKYGGHNKIKGKFTKTRPITLHHGLLTEVLRK